VKLHEGQIRALNSKARYIAMIAGTGGGKTSFIPIWIASQIAQDPHSDYMVVSPTYNMLTNILMPPMMEMLGHTGGTYKALERAYHLRGGGRVFFASADRPYSLEGVHVKALALDEAGQMKRQVWEVAQRRVGLYNGRILIATTPYGLNWLKTEVYDKWKAGDPNYEVIQFASIQNPAYPRAEFERAKRELPDWMFRMFYLGEFSRPEGLVYQDFNPTVHIIEPFDVPQDWIRVIGVDFGYNNPFAAVWCAIDPDNNVYVYREYYEREKLTKEAGLDILEMSQGEFIDAVLCDPSRPEGIEDLRRLGLPSMPANNSVLTGIQKVTEKLKANQLFFFRGLENTLNEIESYSWKVVNGVQTDQPTKEFDHTMDALRYVIMFIVENIEKRSPKGIDVLRGVKIYDKSV